MDWHSQSPEAKAKGVCHTEEECERGYAELPEEKKIAAMQCINLALPENTKQQVREAIAADPENWVAPYHHGWGMAMRNLLREHGLGEDYFGIDNLDCIYTFLIEDALKS